MSQEGRITVKQSNFIDSYTGPLPAGPKSLGITITVLAQSVNNYMQSKYRGCTIIMPLWTAPQEIIRQSTEIPQKRGTVQAVGHGLVGMVADGEGRDRWGGLSEGFLRRPGTGEKVGQVGEAFQETQVVPWGQSLQGVWEVLGVQGDLDQEALEVCLVGLHDQEALGEVCRKEDVMQDPCVEKLVLYSCL